MRVSFLENMSPVATSTGEDGSPTAQAPYDLGEQPELERIITHTKYNELASCEWGPPVPTESAGPRVSLAASDGTSSGTLSDGGFHPAGLGDGDPPVLRLAPLTLHAKPAPALRCEPLPSSVQPQTEVSPMPIREQAGQSYSPSILVAELENKRQRREAGKEAAPKPDALFLKECADMTTALKAGGDDRIAAVRAMRGQVMRYSLDAAGCRVVQLALDVVDARSAEILVEELRGCVKQVIHSPHGNYVIQKVIEVTPRHVSSFVAPELFGTALRVARHRFGCRIVCRLLEHMADDPATKALVDEALEGSLELCHHSFGHHVMQAVLDHGLPQQRHQVALAAYSALPFNVLNRNMSYVMDKALSCCCEQDQKALAAGLLATGQEGFAVLAQNHRGVHIIKSLLNLQGEFAGRALEYIKMGAPSIRQTKYGKRLLRELGVEVGA